MVDRYKIHTTTWASSRAQRGQGLDITYGWHKTVLGPVMIARTNSGICFIGLETRENGKTRAEERLQRYFPAATIKKNPSRTADDARAIDSRWRAHPFAAPLFLDLYGTEFQITVWRALLKIPFGKLVSYAEIAAAIKAPQSARAVGGAVGDNPVSLLVPCHRVIQSSGKWDNYGWGSDVKTRLIQLEQAA